MRKLFLLASCALIGAGVVSAGATTAVSASETHASSMQISKDEHLRTIEAMKPPKRSRPVVAVLANNAGAETTDFLVPYGVLTQSGVADVLAVAPTNDVIQLRPTLKIKPQATLSAFDERFPDGADYVIVPAMRSDDPVILGWIKAQAAKGATIVGICAGTMVLSNAGLLKDRAATGYWLNIDQLRADNPGMRWVPNRRYVADRGVVTTTGITASMPASLALVEAIAGRAKAAALAQELGAKGWSEEHDSAAFGASQRQLVQAAAANRSARPTPIGVPVSAGVDEIALAFTADAFSRPYGTLAMTVAGSSGEIKTKRGLTLVPDRVAGSATAPETMIPDLGPAKPAEAMDAVLAAIEQRSGKDIAKLVALQMEYAR